MKKTPNCDKYKENSWCIDCYYYKDRCTFLDSDTQLWLSDNEGDM